MINGRDFEEYFGRSTTKMVMKQPLELTALGQFRWSLLPKTFSIEFSVFSRLLSASERV